MKKLMFTMFTLFVVSTCGFLQADSGLLVWNTLPEAVKLSNNAGESQDAPSNVGIKANIDVTKVTTYDGEKLCDVKWPKDVGTWKYNYIKAYGKKYVKWVECDPQ